mmetsp:Transcript_8423/g.17339  ORF Transcript_8423/g.17339 Transcript_8423/m.17339 type:complete len:254 (-) Transcript_8423:36-797(-)
MPLHLPNGQSTEVLYFALLPGECNGVSLSHSGASYEVPPSYGDTPREARTGPPPPPRSVLAAFLVGPHRRRSLQVPRDVLARVARPRPRLNFNFYLMPAFSLSKKTSRASSPLTVIGSNSSVPLGRCEGDCDGNAECGTDLECFLRENEADVPGCSGDLIPGISYCVAIVENNRDEAPFTTVKPTPSSSAPPMPFSLTSAQPTPFPTTGPTTTKPTPSLPAQPTFSPTTGSNFPSKKPKNKSTKQPTYKSIKN